MTREQEIGIVKGTIDGLSLTTLGAWAVGWLPAIATLLTIVWTFLRILEMKQVQKWLGNSTEAAPPPSLDHFEGSD